MNFILTKRNHSFFGLAKSEDLSDDEKQWDAMLTSYEFLILDEFDAVLLDGIRQGFFDNKKVAEKAGELHSQFTAKSSEESFSAAWRKYHDSFHNDEPEVLNAIYDSFKRDVRYISPTNLDGTIRLFKELGQQTRARELLDYYMAERQEHRNFYDLDENPFGGEIRDEDVRAAFEEKCRSFKDERSPADVLASIETGWNKADIDLLSKLSADDFYNIFKTLKGRDLSRIVQSALMFSRVQGVGDEERQISEKATEALRRVAKESTINRRRVQKFIKVDG